MSVLHRDTLDAVTAALALAIGNAFLRHPSAVTAPPEARGLGIALALVMDECKLEPAHLPYETIARRLHDEGLRAVLGDAARGVVG